MNSSGPRTLPELVDRAGLRSGARHGSRRLIALAGSVGVGKSTLAAELQRLLASAGTTSTVVGTDAFLLPNSTLQERGLLLRKGYPESYDIAAIQRFFAVVRSEANTVETPLYSHRTFDLDGTQLHVLGDVVIVEGVNALQSPLRDDVDIRVYLDAPEPIVRAWFVTRMLGFIEQAEQDPASFYAQFAAFDLADRSAFATRVWEEINLPNLVTYIEPTRTFADWVVTTNAVHHIVSITDQR
jgi:type I pantothenate kinase